MWFEYIENKEGICRIYENIEPPLDNLYIHELSIETGESMCLILRFDLTKLPDKLPVKWKNKDVNTIQIVMLFIEVNIHQISISNKNFYNGQLLIEEIEDNIKQVKYIDKSGAEVINFNAKWIHIKNLSGYHNTKSLV